MRSFSRRFVILFAASLALIPSFAFSKGGIKGNNQIEVKNNTGVEIAVILDNNIVNPNNPIAFQAVDGVFINHSDQFTFNDLKNGYHTVYVYIPNGSSFTSSPATTTVFTEDGDARIVAVSLDHSGNVVFSLQ